MLYFFSLFLAFISFVTADNVGGCKETPPTSGLGLRPLPVLARWRRGTEATICFDGSWTNAADRRLATTWLTNARDTWNNASMGVTFSFRTNCNYASVVVRRRAAASEAGVLADCGWPNSNGWTELTVYDYWFSTISAGETYPRTTMTHELGHFLGFDHEFEKGLTSVSDVADRRSVMGNATDRTFTTRDGRDARRFYNYDLNYFPGRTISVYSVRKFTPPRVRHCCGKFLGVCYKYCV